MGIDGYLLKSYFKVVSKVWGYAFAAAFWLAVLGYFVFKISFASIIAMALMAAFYLLPLMIASFFVVLIVALEPDEDSDKWKKTLLGGFLALVGIALTRVSITPQVGFGENASPSALIATMVSIALGAVVIVVVFAIFFSQCRRNCRNKINKSNSLLEINRQRLLLMLCNTIQFDIIVVFAGVVLLMFAQNNDTFERLRDIIMIAAAGVLALSCLPLLLRAVANACVKAKYLKAYSELRAEIIDRHLANVLFSDYDTLYDLFSDAPAVERYPKLIAQILDDGVAQKRVFRHTFEGRTVYTTKNDKNEIITAYKKETSIFNKTDLSILAIAVALHITKAIVTPIIGEKIDYGKGFDPKDRLKHDDKSIKKKQREKIDKFADKFRNDDDIKNWIKDVKVPYDIISGTHLSGRNHRPKTLGHDPKLGWIFGTANIITNTITYSDFRTFRVLQSVTTEEIPLFVMFAECLQKIMEEKWVLPAALCKQACHIESDKRTKLGIPVSRLDTFNDALTEKLYSKHYDHLCAQRDKAFVGASATVSILFNAIIELVHGLFYDSADGPKELYEIRTRKILLISNSLASSFNLVQTVATKDVRKLDIGGLLVTLGRLVSDVGFMYKVKKELMDFVPNVEECKELMKLNERVAQLNMAQN